MRFKGTIAEWNDDRGFGFIRPAEGGDRVFCHIKAFHERSKRPALNTTVTYELARDDRGRPQARQIRYSSTSRPPVTRQALVPSSAQLTLAIVGASAFFVYGWDKVSAEGGHWRTGSRAGHGPTPRPRSRFARHRRRDLPTLVLIGRSTQNRSSQQASRGKS
jgi:cold shock CspA family protein